MDNTISGPFGNYKHGSAGALLNAMVRNENIPVTLVENIKIGTVNDLYDNHSQVGRYKWVDGLENPIFMWTNEKYRCYKQHQFTIDKDVLIPKFRPTLGIHGSPCFEIYGHDATPELHEFLLGMLTNVMTDPRYKIHQDAGAFFQGGAHNPDGEFFMIEFWKPAGIKAFMDYLNSNYRPKI